jgi:hypothetical protein
MADITKCNDSDCPLRENCYRFTAKESDWQYYFMNSLRVEEKDTCNYYWETKEKNKTTTND